MKNLNPMAYHNAILTFLNEKYGETFTVLKLYQEFEGQSGMAVRALCKQIDGEDTFSVYCYLDPNIAAEHIVIDEDEHAITDAYTGVLLQNKLLQQICVDSQQCIVKCRVVFGLQPSFPSDDFSELQDAELDPYAKFYIMAPLNASVEDVQNQIVHLLNTYKPCTGYVYVAYVEDFHPENLLNTYAEKQTDFGYFLAHSDFAKRLEFVLYKKDTGLQEKKVIKE